MKQHYVAFTSSVRIRQIRAKEGYRGEVTFKIIKHMHYNGIQRKQLLITPEVAS